MANGFMRLGYKISEVRSVGADCAENTRTVESDSRLPAADRLPAPCP